MPALRCAFFDVDGTLITRDSFRTLMLRLLADEPWRIVQLPLALPLFLACAVVARDRRWSKSVLLWFLTWGAARKTIVRRIKRVMHNEWSRLWFLEASSCFEDLRTKRKCHTVFVSASGQLWLRHLLRAMDGTAPKTVIGSRLGFWFLNGVVYKSKNCFHAEKLVRIRERLGDDLEWVVGYSDHHVDIPMLEKCAERVVVSPSERNRLLFKKALGDNFRLERWRAPLDFEK